MLTRWAIVASKELADHCRDTRSLVSSALYALMGPAVVLLVLVARGDAGAAAARQPWPTMASVFAVMAVFTSVAALATDMIAGERERRSLVPLICAVARRESVVIGKWLATASFGAMGLVLSVLAFAAVLAPFQGSRLALLDVILIAPALLPLVLLAAALAAWISAACRTTKEATTWWSMVTFAVMGASMWLAFRPDTADGWAALLPVLGQQRLIAWGFTSATLGIADAAVVARQAVLLGATTLAATGLVVLGAWRLLRRDEAVERA